MTSPTNPASSVKSSPLSLTVLSLLHYQPLHPYGIQRLIKQWGKDQVVNVSQRASLYRTIERLLGAGLIEVRETERDQQYPERTVYEVTEEGRRTTRAWLVEMLAKPKQEYPEFPAALSFLVMLNPEETLKVFSARAESLRASLREIDAIMSVEAEHRLPRVTMLETEYQRVTTSAQLAWLDAVIADLRAGRLSWSPEELIAFAESEGAAAEG
ncbi:PadR family transcriptional regulator [Streptacidiphilus melanogenes]|uniref:PadR family transcriptional regulator n=1 Tax=Streptacidiphilus melanogenes TaxID=411235 RepID=UPI0005A94012|nr:PadR family transcriptional regulator [Streptacidiphilus melanogenes]